MKKLFLALALLFAIGAYATPDIKTEVTSNSVEYSLVINGEIIKTTIPMDGPGCGCTDQKATNFDPMATSECDPSTCTYLTISGEVCGCGDETAINYNPNVDECSRDICIY